MTDQTDSVVDDLQIDDSANDEASAFDEAVLGKPDGQVDTDDRKQEVKESVDEAIGKTDPGDGDKDVDDSPAEPPVEKTAKEKAEERAKKFESESDPEPVDPEPEPKAVEKAAPIPKEAPKPSTAMTKEQVANLLNTIPEDELPEGEIIIGDTLVNLREYKEDSPEEYAAMTVVAGAMAQKILDKIVPDMVPATKFQEMQDQYQNDINNFGYWLQLMGQHPDALSVSKSSEFTGWLEGQSSGIKKLASSADVEDAASVLDMFKEEQAKVAVKKHDNAVKGKKQSKDDLHSASLRDVAKKTTEDLSDADDEQAGFNAYLSREK